MAAFPCPYCGHSLTTSPDEPLEHCPSCDGSLLIAYRYRLIAARGEISGGVLYEAVDDGFGEKVAVLFVSDPDDSANLERFLEGNRLFAELSGRGLAKVFEVSSRSDRRPYVVMDWISAGTLESRVTRRGPIDQAALFEIIRDLLTGLGRAHRSMPAVVHAHIHPGKIGFIGEIAVLFGFEWAKQVFEQDSNLADAFVREDDSAGASARAEDLRMLGRALLYAATGEWVADHSVGQQRALAQARIPGPLGVVIDRMLGAGDDGYKSAVDAAIDLEKLLQGTSTWRHRERRQQDRSSDFASSAWSADAGPSPSGYTDDDDPFEEVEEVEELADLFAAEPPPAPHRAAPSPPPAPAATFDSQSYHQYQQAAEAAAAEAQTQVNPGKLVGVVIGITIAMGTCVAGLVADEADNNSYTPPPPVIIEPVPIPEPIEIPSYDPIPTPSATQIEGIHRYAGSITGPDDIAGRELGERCDVWVEPNGGGRLNCRWYIDCGDPRQRIYGGGNVGYTTCTVIDGHPTSAADNDDDGPDGAFMAVIDGADSMVLVTDRWLLPPTRVLIQLDEGGGFHPGPIPDVPLASRYEREAIEAAMARGESPEFSSGPPDQLSNDELLAVLDTSLEELHICAVEPGTTLQVAIDIRRNGKVRKAAIDPPPENAAAGRCVTQTIRRLRFPEFTGEPMSINWNVSW